MSNAKCPISSCATSILGVQRWTFKIQTIHHFILSKNLRTQILYHSFPYPRKRTHQHLTVFFQQRYPETTEF